jgi:hypothetical protein
MFSARQKVIARCWKSRHTPTRSVKTSSAVRVERAWA